MSPLVSKPQIKFRYLFLFIAIIKKQLTFLLILFAVLFTSGCSDRSDDSNSTVPDFVVNSLEDAPDPPDGMVTLRSALASAADGQRFVFDT